MSILKKYYIVYSGVIKDKLVTASQVAKKSGLSRSEWILGARPLTKDKVIHEKKIYKDVLFPLENIEYFGIENE